LQPVPALLDIVGYPPDTEISIDGSAKGRVGSNGKLANAIEVAPGSHDVKISHEGYQPLEIRRTFVSNDKVSYRADSARLVAVVKPVVEPSKKRADPDAAITQEWSNLENSGDVNALEAFRSKHPGTQWGSKAGDRINQIDDHDWQTALQANSIQALDGYSSKHRTGRHIQEASQRIADAAWNRVNKSDALAVRAFIEQYPNSPHKADAQTIVDQLERQKLDAEQRTKQERAQHAQAPNDANSRGITLFKAQRYEEAIASFAEAIRLKPDLANAYFNRGAAYYKLGQFQSAISDFDQTLALDPQDQSAALQKQQAKKRLASGVYFAGKDVTKPVYVTWTNPKYSKEAIRAGKTGTVLLTFVVDEYGRVKDCQVLKSLTPDLDGRAIYAASHATFKPGKKRGKPVPVEVTVEVKFDQP
jgi:TonB family protein